MRLSNQHHAAIRSTFAETFRAGASVWLFGSRVDDNKRGGDIVAKSRPPIFSIVKKKRHPAMNASHSSLRLKEQHEERHMLDKLNRLEKLGYLQSAQAWQEIR